MTDKKFVDTIVRREWNKNVLRYQDVLINRRTRVFDTVELEERRLQFEKHYTKDSKYIIAGNCIYKDNELILYYKDDKQVPAFWYKQDNVKVLK